MTLLFFDEDDARAVAERLAADGHDVVRRRERFAGEDDDEDQPWAVVSDAPAELLDLLAAEHDGWRATDQPEDPTPDPGTAGGADLPTGPRRHHRPH